MRFGTSIVCNKLTQEQQAAPADPRGRRMGLELSALLSGREKTRSHLASAATLWIRSSA
jgi:hypothetical protein